MMSLHCTTSRPMLQGPPLPHPRILLFIAAFTWSAAIFAETPAPASPTAQPSPATAPKVAPPQPKVSFGAPEMQLWQGRTQFVAVTLPSKASETLHPETTISPAGSAEILFPATILKGEKIGYLRLRSLTPGKATLRVGATSIPVTISPNPAGDVLASRPEIISPSEGAFIYGTITAGVELNMPDGHEALQDPRLVLPNGTELAPRAQTLPTTGSARLYAFDINADDLPAGPLTLHTYAKNADGQRVAGESVALTVFRPDTSLMISGPCSGRINDPRPQRFGEKLPKVETNDPAAPDGYVANYSADPAWCFKETVETPGYYQLTMRVRGDAAAGSFPSVGLFLNEEDRAKVGVRLVDSGWHRVPIGRPVWLEAGEQTLTARYLNDFSHGKRCDRNLKLDRYELVRISANTAATASRGTDDGASMMMSDSGGGDAMMAESASGAPMMGEGGAMSMMDGAAAEASDLRVSFSRPIHGQIVQGPLYLRVNTWRGKKTEAPVVDLTVNGQVVASQQGTDVNFRIPMAALSKGSNVLQLHARTAKGARATSPAETVILQSAPTERPAVQRVMRYTVEDEAWDRGMVQRLEKNKITAAFFTNGEATLTLPEDLEGAFSFNMEGRGQDYQGPPVVEAFIRSGTGEPQKIGEAAVAQDRNWALGRSQLTKGPKQLILKYSNDLAAGKEQDRNWWLRAVNLEENIKRSAEPPRLSVLYPKFTTAPLVVHDACAIVAEVFSPEGIEWADLMVDGKSLNLRINDEDGLGRVVLPLVTTTLTPGEHRLRVAARAKNGKETLSEDILLHVVDKPEAADRTYARAIHLLNRFAYGPEPEELADLLLLGEKAWLKDRLSRAWNDPGEQAAHARAGNEYRDMNNRNDVVGRVLSHFLRSPNPVRNRFVLWTENHFSTWIEKANPWNKWPEHQRFLELGAAPFSDLLMASATSPAMLVYLDQGRSFANKINENYAREIMELHTVGVKGGYKQEDVTNLASLLTGWALSSEVPTRGSTREMARVFRYEPGLNNPDELRVFGMKFPKAADLASRHDRTLSAIEMLAAHPSTARYISRKLAEHYVSVPAPAPLVDKLAQCFTRTGGDMAEMLQAIAESPEFWASAGQPKIATPLDFSLRISRMTQFGNANTVRDFLRKSGTGLFDRATPDGYPEVDAAYADSNALLQRWRFTTSITGNLRKLVPSASVPGSDKEWDETSQRAALDLVATRLVGYPLPETSRQAATQYLSAVLKPDSDRPRIVTGFVAQLPQSSLR